MAVSHVYFCCPYSDVNDTVTTKLFEYLNTIDPIWTHNTNISRVTGPLCGDFTGRRWIPRTKACDAELWCFLWSAPWILSKQSWGWWFETSSHLSWRHCNIIRDRWYQWCTNVFEKSFLCYLCWSGDLVFIHIHTTKYPVAKGKPDNVCHEGREYIDIAGDKVHNIVTCRVIFIS